MNIIGLMAEKGSGKDTVGEYLIEKYGYQASWFAAPMKRGVMEIFDMREEQVFGTQAQKEEVDPRWGVSGRDILQIMGTEMFQYDIHKYLPNLKVEPRMFWVERFKKWYNSNGMRDTPIVLCDMRFQHEVDMIREMGGEVWKINRPDVGGNDQHGSETELHNIKNFNWLLDNNSTLNELYKKVDKRLASAKFNQ